MEISLNDWLLLDRMRLLRFQSQLELQVVLIRSGDELRIICKSEHEIQCLRDRATHIMELAYIILGVTQVIVRAIESDWEPLG